MKLLIFLLGVAVGAAGTVVYLATVWENEALPPESSA